MTKADTSVLFVKKVLADGEPCRKCRDVETRLHKDGLMRHLDEILTAREDEPESRGNRLARRLRVTRAPFFVIRHSDGREQVIESYLSFKRWFSQVEEGAADLVDVVDQHPSLAFL